MQHHPKCGCHSDKRFTLGNLKLWLFYGCCCLWQTASPVSHAASIELEPIDIYAYTQDAPDDYFPQTSSATKGDVPRLNIPQSIDVRSAQMLQDFGGLPRIDNLSKTVAGVHSIWRGNGGTNLPIVNFRGFSNSGSFPNNGDILKDGYRKLGFIHMTADSAYIERVEWIKGPSAALFGKTDSLGGTINLVSKRPLANTQHHANVSTGSFDFYRTALDSNFSLHEGTQGLRFNAAIEKARSFRDYAWHETYAIAPALTHHLSNGDAIHFLLDYTHTNMQGDFGLPITPAFRQVPINRYVQGPNFDRTRAWSLNSLVEYQHQLGDDWQLSLGLSNSWSDWDQHYTRPVVTNRSLAPYLVTREPNTEHTVRENKDIELKLQGNTQLAGLTQQFLIGAGRAQNNRKSDNFRSANTSTFDLQQPEYNAPVIFNLNLPEGSAYGKNVIYSLYLLDTIDVNHALKLQLGARYDQAKQATRRQSFFGITAQDTQTDAHYTPSYALLYQPNANNTLYASYSTSFAQRINPRLNPTARFKPEIGKQYELGLKQKYGRDFTVEAAIYELTRQNVVLSDIRVPFSDVQTAEQKSVGLELSLNGNINDQLRVSSAYTWMKAKVTRDNVIPIGDERVGVPRHTFNLFSIYAPNGAGNGWEIGTNLYYASATQATLPNSFMLPNNFQWDAMLKYHYTPEYAVQMHLKNITNHHNYMATADFGYITIGEPRSLYLNLLVNYK